VEDKSQKEMIAGGAKLSDLMDELWIILPFFVFSLFVFLGSFQYKTEASTVPMIIGFITTVLTGMRLVHIAFPMSKIGEFKEAGLADDFDSMKDRIGREALKGHYEEETIKVTFRDEKKAFIALIGCFVIFLLLGYMVGILFVIIGSSYFYGYKNKGSILVSLITMYFIVYVLLYRLLDAPLDFGLVLGPILQYFDLL